MRLLPGLAVLWRSDREAQVGLSSPLLLTELTEAEQRFLASLEGSGVRAAQAAEHPGLVEKLEDARLLDSVEGASAPLAGTRVDLHGTGPLGLAVAEALARGGATLSIADPALVSAEMPGTFGLAVFGHTCAAATADAVRSRVPASRVDMSTGGGHVEVHVTMGCPDPVLTLSAMQRSVPHVLVVADESGVDVGPLVVPGHSACGQCLGLHRAEQDPAWPRLAVQLAGSRRSVAAADVVPAVAGLAASMITGWTRGESWPATSAWRCESGAAPMPLAVHPHPECGCGALGDPGDEVAAQRARKVVRRERPSAVGPV